MIMLSVLVAATSFPRWEGDYRGTFVWEGCRALAALGVRVRVVAPHSRGAAPHEELDGVEILRPRHLPDRWEFLLETPGGLPVLWEHRRSACWTVLPFLLTHAAAIAREARNCDLIHAHWTLSAFAALLGAPLHRRPLLCTVQGSDVYRAMRLPVFGALSRAALGSARRVIALSRSLAEAAAAQGIDPDKIAVLPNGVDFRRFAPNGNPREPVVLFAGSLIERKGVRTLIEAMAAVRQRHPAYRLVLIGDGPQRAELESLARRLNPPESVRFAGSLAPAEVARWMRRAELFVLPSLEEGQGVALLEALASGTPCVGASAGGIPDILSPEWGLLVPPGDPQALGEAVLDLLEHADRRRAMGNAAVSAVRERYGWPVIARRLLALYGEAAAAPSVQVGNSRQV
jgi:glycosyltransferase involved in cell wall biosynthesis